ncbi:MAG: hypothetical protein KBS52_07000 [Clostridiales bacterium]|nr:hypothetical protein [Candidatus Equinaster intestinalis]
MKKIITVVVTLALIFSLAVLPANAEVVEAGIQPLPSNEGELTGNQELEFINVDKELVIKKGAVIKTEFADIDYGAKLTIEDGATLEITGGFFYVEGTLQLDGKLFGNIESSVRIKNINVGANGSMRFVFSREGTARGFAYDMKEMQVNVNVIGNTVIINGSHTHEYENNICKICGLYACEAGDSEHTYKEGICTYCNAVDNSHTHRYENGVCRRCGLKCLHEEFDSETQKCKVCGSFICVKNGHKYNGGKCTVCGNTCKNEFHNNIFACPECGMRLYPYIVGTVLSNGSLTIVILIAVAVVFGIIGFFIGRKKKSTAKKPENEEKAEQ